MQVSAPPASSPMVAYAFGIASMPAPTAVIATLATPPLQRQRPLQGDEVGGIEPAASGSCRECSLRVGADECTVGFDGT